MQYILTQAEYDALTPVSRLQERNEALEHARKLIVENSDHVCHHDMTEEQYEEFGGYPPLCDDCPIGKMNDNYKLSKKICGLSREYSK
jgi:hypothetical protein